MSKNKLAGNPALEAFVDFYLSDDGLAVIGTGAGQVPYVPLAAPALEATRAAWAGR